MLSTQTTSAGLTWRSAAMAGSAMLAIAVSSEASASVVKIAATAQRLSSGGKPSMGGAGGFMTVGSEDIAIGFSAPGQPRPPRRVLRTRGGPQGRGCMMHMRRDGAGSEKGADGVYLTPISRCPRHFVPPTFGYLSARDTIA